MFAAKPYEVDAIKTDIFLFDLILTLKLALDVASTSSYTAAVDPVAPVCEYCEPLDVEFLYFIVGYPTFTLPELAYDGA